MFISLSDESKKIVLSELKESNFMHKGFFAIDDDIYLILETSTIEENPYISNSNGYIEKAEALELNSGNIVLIKKEVAEDYFQYKTSLLDKNTYDFQDCIYILQYLEGLDFKVGNTFKLKIKTIVEKLIKNKDYYDFSIEEVVLPVDMQENYIKVFQISYDYGFSIQLEVLVNPYNTIIGKPKLYLYNSEVFSFKNIFIGELDYLDDYSLLDEYFIDDFIHYTLENKDIIIDI